MDTTAVAPDIPLCEVWTLLHLPSPPDSTSLPPNLAHHHTPVDVSTDDSMTSAVRDINAAALKAGSCQAIPLFRVDAHGQEEPLWPSEHMVRDMTDLIELLKCSAVHASRCTGMLQGVRLTWLLLHEAQCCLQQQRCALPTTCHWLYDVHGHFHLQHVKSIL